METGDRLRELRTKRRMTQRELAAKLGINEMTVTLWENQKARRPIATKYINRLAQILDVRVSDLLGEGEVARQQAAGSPMVMTQTLAEVQLLRMFRMMSEELKLVQLAQFVDCVGRGNLPQASRYDATIDAGAHSTILGILG